MKKIISRTETGLAYSIDFADLTEQIETCSEYVREVGRGKLLFLFNHSYRSSPKGDFYLLDLEELGLVGANDLMLAIARDGVHEAADYLLELHDSGAADIVSPSQAMLLYAKHEDYDVLEDFLANYADIDSMFGTF